MDTTFGSFLIGMASIAGFAVVMKIVHMNWSFIRNLLTFFCIGHETSMEGLQVQRTGSSITRRIVMPKLDREGPMPFKDSCMENNLKVADSSMSDDVDCTLQSTGLSEGLEDSSHSTFASNDLSTEIDNTHHLVDIEIGSL